MKKTYLEDIPFTFEEWLNIFEEIVFMSYYESGAYLERYCTLEDYQLIRYERYKELCAMPKTTPCTACGA